MTIPNLPAEFFTQDFLEAWECWTEYRKERRLPAYKPMGLRMQMKRLVEMGQKRAIAAIEYSIAQNYQGIFEDRYATTQRPTTANSRTAGTLNADTQRYASGPGVLGGRRQSPPPALPGFGPDAARGV